MNTAQSNNFEKLLSLQDAAAKLNVSVETMISWNEHNIIKPTITKEGVVGYTESQLNQFAATVQKFLHHVSPALGETPNTPPVYQETPIHQPLTNKYTVPPPHTDPDDVKQFSSKQLLFFAVIIIILTSVFTQRDANDSSDTAKTNQQALKNILGVHTSTLPLSGQFGLPIQLARESTQEKHLRDEQDTNSLKEKTIASALYVSKPSGSNGKNNVSASNTPEYRTNSNTLYNANSYATKAFFSPLNDETSAIDEHGNIRGEAETETLAMVVGNIDEKIKTDSFQQASIHATNQLILIFIGMLAVLFGLQKQLAFVNRPGKKIAMIQPVHHESLPLTPEKILEVIQKTDGSVVLLFNDTEYKISKPEMNSESDQFIERLMTLTKSNIKEIEYDITKAGAIGFATPLSRLVTRLGFVGIKRDLFFPRTSKTSVLFRKYLTKQDLITMNITIDHIRNELDLLS